MPAVFPHAYPGDASERKGSHMRTRTVISSFILGCICLTPVSVLGSGFPDTYGVGCRAMALGGAFTAVADNYAAAYYNPAGLSQTDDHHMTVEYIYTHPSISVKTAEGDLKIYDVNGNLRNDPTEATGADGLDFQYPVMGLILDVNKIAKLPVNVQVGLAASFTENFDTCYRMHDYPPDQPHFIRYGDNVDRLLLAMGIGVEVVKDLVHLGVGCQTMVYGPGKFYVDGLSLSGQDVVAQAEFDALQEYDPIAGILITPLDQKLKIGFSWRDEQELQEGPIPAVAAVKVGDLSETVTMILDINCFFTPEEYSLGLAYDFSPLPLMVSVEANKQRWSAYEYSITDTYHYTGSPGFKDTINYRLGVEYKPSDKLSLMAGYCHQPSPVPNQSGIIDNYIDMDKDLFSLGASYTLPAPFNITKEPITLAGVLQYQMLDTLSVNKDGVTGISWEDQESYRVEGDVWVAGISLSLSWK